MTVTIGGDFAAARRRIQEMRRRADNVAPGWHEFLDWFTLQNQRQFGTQGRRWGKGWPELASSTLAQKRALGYTSDILIRDASLQHSITRRPMGVERIGPHDMEAGTNVPYAKYHHSTLPRRRLPRRALWSVARIRGEGALTSAITSWIVDGQARVTTRAVV